MQKIGLLLFISFGIILAVYSFVLDGKEEISGNQAVPVELNIDPAQKIARYNQSLGIELVENSVLKSSQDSEGMACPTPYWQLQIFKW